MKCDVEEIWKKHEAKLFNFIKKRIRNNETSKELLHVVLLKLCNYCSKKSDVRNISAWLYQLAYNTIVDHIKRNSRFTTVELDIEDRNYMNAKHDATNWLEYFIKQLPEKYAVPLIFSTLNGMDQNTVALQISLSLPAVKSRILRGRKLLKKKIDNCGIIEFNEDREIYFTPVKPCCVKLLK